MCLSISQFREVWACSRVITIQAPISIHLWVCGLPCGSASKDYAAMQETLVQFLSWEDLLEKG